MKKLFLALVVVVVLVAGGAAAFGFYMVNRMQQPVQGLLGAGDVRRDPSGSGRGGNTPPPGRGGRRVRRVGVSRRADVDGAVARAQGRRVSLRSADERRRSHREDRAWRRLRSPDHVPGGAHDPRDGGDLSSRSGFGTADEFIKAARDAIARERSRSGCEGSRGLSLSRNLYVAARDAGRRSWSR